MERVITVFESSDHIAKGAKGGDGSLELYEFIEAVVKLSFARENPEYGAEGKTDASAVPKPLPGCLETVLKENLLLNSCVI